MSQTNSVVYLNKNLLFQQVGVDKNDIPDISYVSYLLLICIYCMCLHIFHFMQYVLEYLLLLIV